MNHITVTKRSPIVLIRTLIAIEFLFFAGYLLATGYDDYKFGVYNRLFFSGFFSYQTFKIFFLSGAQLIITIYAFIRWYYESYSVRPASLSHQWGVFFKKTKSIPLDASVAITYSSGPFGKLLHYGSIRIEGMKTQRSIVLRDISRPEGFGKEIEQCTRAGAHSLQIKPDLANLLSAEEHEQLEYKASLRFDHKTAQVNRELEKAAMKTVAAFLNSNGGHLVLGVADTKTLLGLHYDYRTLKRPTSDGFENHFTQIFNTMIGPEFRHLVKLWFEKIDDKEMCVVRVTPSNRPAYLTLEEKEQFYIRTGNGTTSLKLSEAESYARSHWQEA